MELIQYAMLEIKGECMHVSFTYTHIIVINKSL